MIVGFKLMALLIYILVLRGICIPQVQNENMTHSATQKKPLTAFD